MPVITFLNPARDANTVSPYSKKVLDEILKKAGIAQVTITSSARTAQDQARIMYENITRHGVAHQKRLYGSYGDKVIDEYASLHERKISEMESRSKSQADIISGMSAKITSLGPGNVSKHAADPKKLNVVDIAPSSINLALRKKFEAAVNSDSRVSKFLTPPGDPAYHIEIPQP